MNSEAAYFAQFYALDEPDKFTPAPVYKIRSELVSKTNRYAYVVYEDDKPIYVARGKRTEHYFEAQAKISEAKARKGG